ncbi:hypothetical protein K439DRAFT_1299266, partial [Ramaria rubella]
FKRGHLTVIYLRNGPSDECTHEAIVWGDWVSHEGIMPTEELVAICKDKSSRKPGWITASTV